MQDKEALRAMLPGLEAAKDLLGKQISLIRQQFETPEEAKKRASRTGILHPALQRRLDFIDELIDTLELEKAQAETTICRRISPRLTG